jgi:hypothetical protein
MPNSGGWADLFMRKVFQSSSCPNRNASCASSAASVRCSRFKFVGYNFVGGAIGPDLRAGTQRHREKIMALIEAGELQ